MYHSISTAQTSEILTRDLTEADIFVDQNGTTLFHSDENVANTEDLFVSVLSVLYLKTICTFFIEHDKNPIEHRKL